MSISENLYTTFPLKTPEPLTIGLVNIMPDAAFLATEHQFAELVGSAAGRRPWAIHLFTLPEVARQGAAAEHAAGIRIGLCSLDRRVGAGQLVEKISDLVRRTFLGEELQYDPDGLFRGRPVDACIGDETPDKLVHIAPHQPRIRGC